MKMILAVLGIVLVTASVASAQCGCVAATPVVYGPTPMVVNYAPAAPVYTYTAYSYPAYGYGYTTYYPGPYVVARPVMAAPVVYPAPYYYYGYYRRPWLYVPGQPVRNVLRATFR